MPKFSISASYPPAIPDAPSTPEITAVTRESITVAWKEPKSDGGSHVFGYHLQMKDKNSILWQRVNKTVIRATHFKVTNINAGLIYEFKVAAENSAGISAFSKVSDAVLAIDACGEFVVDKMHEEFFDLRFSAIFITIILTVSSYRATPILAHN